MPPRRLGAARLRGEKVSRRDVWQACRAFGAAPPRRPRRTDRRRLRLGRHRPAGREPEPSCEEIAAQVRAPGDGLRGRGASARQLPRGRGISALFAGPTRHRQDDGGRGARQRRSDLDLYRIDLAGVVNKYIGETEKNLRADLRRRRGGGAILFFDEADALFGKRTRGQDSHDRYANIEIDYLLQRMEEYRGLAILATNRKAALDQAFLRRLRFVVDFPFPARRPAAPHLAEGASRRRPPTDRIDFGALARLDLTGGNIQSVALNAAFLAAADGRVITMEHLTRAASREYAKLDKTPTEAEFGGMAEVVAS